MPGIGLVVVGGTDGDGLVLSTTEVFNGEKWTDGPSAPSSLQHHCASLFQDQSLFVTGGSGDQIFDQNF